MNKKTKTHTIISRVTLVLALIFTVASCKKDDDHHDHPADTTDKDAPVLSISSPAPLQMYNNGDSVYIKGLATDVSLHEMTIRITDDAGGTQLFYDAPLVHDLETYTIDSKWKSNVSTHTNATVVVTVEDHNENVTSDTVHIHIMP
ncbi:MAG: hypothetical protein H7321_06175 [Bacteroidia bacterium]|nr:hypothetical protein [Bacteroidia bacterium]